MMWLWIGVICVLLGASIWAFFIEPRWYLLRTVKIPGQKKLRKPFTILHLSDCHFQKNETHKKHFFQRLSMLNPDLLVLTGDIIENNDGIDTAIQFISGIRARYGAVFVMGNHDYYDYHWIDTARYYMRLASTAVHRNDVPRFKSELKRIGVRVLVNESFKLDIHGNEVWIGGTDDPVTQKVDMNKAIEGKSPHSYNLLLTHHLDALLKLHHHGIDLVLAGHTHGGQVRLPIWGPIVCETRLPRKYVDGLHDYRGTAVFVSKGVGSGRLLTPRFSCRPEAILIEVTP